MNNLPPRRSKSRGLHQLFLRIGDITKEIDRRIKLGKQVKILEVGCGYGVALLDLHNRYGSQVDLYGITKSPDEGNIATLKSIAIERGLLSAAEINTIKLPEFHYFDVCGDWYFPDETFDIVFSQHAFLWFEDKIKPLEEINRIMKTDGIALIDLSVKQTGSLKKSSIIIQQNDIEIPFGDYVRQFNNITIKKPKIKNGFIKQIWYKIKHNIGIRTKTIRRRARIEMRKAHNLTFNLEFVSSRHFSEISQSRQGYQSIYKKKPL